MSAGARLPTQCQVVPSGPLTVPVRALPVSFPSKTRSVLLSSSSFGETKVSLPSATSTLGIGRALPQRLVIRALSWPPSSVISIHEGQSRSGAFKVRSQRPRNFDAAEAVAELSAMGAAARPGAGAYANRNTTAAVMMILGNFTIE